MSWCMEDSVSQCRCGGHLTVEETLNQSLREILWTGGLRGRVLSQWGKCLQVFSSFPHKQLSAEVSEEDIYPMPQIKRLRNEGLRSRNENM